MKFLSLIWAEADRRTYVWISQNQHARMCKIQISNQSDSLPATCLPACRLIASPHTQVQSWSIASRPNLFKCTHLQLLSIYSPISLDRILWKVDPLTHPTHLLASSIVFGYRILFLPSNLLLNLLWFLPTLINMYVHYPIFLRNTSDLS